MDHELDKNTPNAAQNGHELTEIRKDSRDFIKKKAYPWFGGISSKVNVHS